MQPGPSVFLAEPCEVSLAGPLAGGQVPAGGPGAIPAGVVGGLADGREGDDGGEAAGGPLPCLNSHKCTEDFEWNPDEELDAQHVAAWNALKGTHRKTAYALTWNVSCLVAKVGLERTLFVTLTFADHVTDNKEASRRWKSFRTHFLSKEATAWVAVRERQKSGRLHFHIVMGVPADVRTGVNFEEFAAGRYRSASRWLHDFWDRLREAARLYGFGRTEALPIKSTVEGVSRYVGKYIAKNIEGRIEDDRGARLVQYSQTMQKAGDHLRPNDFAWNSKRASLWRRKLAKVADRCGFTSGGDFKLYFGTRWAFSAAVRIMSENLGVYGQDGVLTTVYPSVGHALADGKDIAADAHEAEGEVTVTEVRTQDWAEAHLEEALLDIRKAFSFDRIRRDREAIARVNRESPRIPDAPS